MSFLHLCWKRPLVSCRHENTSERMEYFAAEILTTSVPHRFHRFSLFEILSIAKGSLDDFVLP
jgi:hypothetical protein